MSAAADAPVLDGPAGRRAGAALLLGAVAVGCAPILVRVSEVGPAATAFFRVALSLGPLLAIALAMRGDAAGRPRGVAGRLAAAIPGLFLGAELVVWHLSLHMTSVANATLLLNMTPVFTALVGWIVLRQPVGRATVSGIALAVAGVAALTRQGAHGGAGSPAGDAVALLAAAIYAGYFLTLGRARRRFPARDVMLWSAVSASAFTLPLALSEPAILPATALGWASLLALAWVVQAAGQGLVTFAVAWVPPTLSSLTMLIQPVVAAGLAWILLGERLEPAQIVGGLVVILGLLTARRGLATGAVTVRP